MAPRFSRPRLISADDGQYRAFLAHIMLGKENQRAIRPPRARDLFGGEAEKALRGWLAQSYTLSERRIVEYLEHRNRVAIKKYRELDAVVLPDPKSIMIFEVKASRNATSLRRAMQQLRDTRTIVGMLYPRVSTTILLVDTGIPTTADVVALMATPDAPTIPPPTLDEVLATLPQVRRIVTLGEHVYDPHVTTLLRFSVDDIVALVGAEHVHLDWDEEGEEEVDEEEPIEPRYAYTTDATSGASDDEEEGALGAALRRMLEQQGGEQPPR